MNFTVLYNRLLKKCCGRQENKVYHRMKHRASKQVVEADVIIASEVESVFDPDPNRVVVLTKSFSAMFE